VQYQNFFDGSEPWDSPTDNNPVTVANNVQFLTDGWLIGMRFLRRSDDAQCHMAMVQDTVNGFIYRAAVYKDWPITPGDPSRWETVYFTPRLPIAANDVYVLAVWFKAGKYSRILDYMSGGDVTHGNLRMHNFSSTFHAGIFTYAANLDPGSEFGAGIYAVDAVFTEVG
jgi:hypothetical protein